MLVVATALVALLLATISEETGLATRPCRAAVARVSDGTDFARVIGREEVRRAARATVIVLGTFCLPDELAIEALAFVRHTRSARVYRAAFGVVTWLTGGARCGSRNTVLVIGATLVTLVIATRRVVPAFTYGL